MFKFLNPNKAIKIADYILPWSKLFTLTFILIGVYYIYKAPLDYQQGEAYRIIYVHVPSAWMALFIYSFMAFTSITYLIWKSPLSSVLAISAAPIGAMFAFITLVTGSLWGKPIWGAWWVWDARLTSMLVLFFFYIGYLMLLYSFENKYKAEKSIAILCIIGFIDIPIVKFSVNLWNSLHQPASIIRMEGTSIHGSMLKPLILMLCGFLLYFITVLIIKMKTELLERKNTKKF